MIEIMSPEKPRRRWGAKIAHRALKQCSLWGYLNLDFAIGLPGRRQVGSRRCSEAVIPPNLTFKLELDRSDLSA